MKGSSFGLIKVQSEHLFGGTEGRKFRVNSAIAET